jgi:phosphate/sulfate permease/DNA-binding CsgD family transcriptional regulator
MTPETAIVVVLSQALVLFVFSSTTLSNAIVSIGLPAIPLVPVSSTQVVVGSVVGIGLVKGMQEVKFKMIGNIMLGWLLTPVLSGAVTFFSLFFVDSVFRITVTNKELLPDMHEDIPGRIVNYRIPIEFNSVMISALIILLTIFVFYLVIRYLKNKEKAEQSERRWVEQSQFTEYQKALSDIEVNTVQLENTNLAARLEEKRSELVTYSLSISEQKQYIESMYTHLQDVLKRDTVEEKNTLLKQLLTELKQKMSFAGEVDRIYQQAEMVHAYFIEKLNLQYPDLTAHEKRLLVLLRIGLSSKEIAPLLNISVKSVEINRYRLRKKLKLDNNINLVEFTKTM